MNSYFDSKVLEVILGSRYTIDLPKMNVKSREEALQFIFTYGYDISNYKDSEVLWKTHRKAIEILEEEVLDLHEQIPERVRNREELEDLTDLLLIASYGDQKELQKFACAILRVMHIIIQLENDLFTSFTDDIKYQLLRPIQEHIFKGEKDSIFLGDSHDIELQSFSVKPFKQTRSAVIKLLAKDDVLAMTLLDRVGVRFVTKSLYDIFRVIRYLVVNNLISYPHTLGGQSKNLICPVELYIQLEKERQEKELSPKELEEKIKERLKDWKEEGNQLVTKNKYSSPEFKFLKFISRRFLKIDRGPNKDPLNFFYPFEIQIIDEETHKQNESTAASHASYKERQRRAARRRVFGLS